MATLLVRRLDNPRFRISLTLVNSGKGDFRSSKDRGEKTQESASISLSRFRRDPKPISIWGLSRVKSLEKSFTVFMVHGRGRNEGVRGFKKCFCPNYQRLLPTSLYSLRFTRSEWALIYEGDQSQENKQNFWGRTGRCQNIGKNQGKTVWMWWRSVVK